MVIIAELSVHPIGIGTSVGTYVRAAVQAISKIPGLKYQVTPMSTVLESQSLDTILRAVVSSHEAVKRCGAKRVSSVIRIDERLDKPRTMRDKVDSISSTL